jgi:hypothetical protein
VTKQDKTRSWNGDAVGAALKNSCITEEKKLTVLYAASQTVRALGNGFCYWRYNRLEPLHHVLYCTVPTGRTPHHNFSNVHETVRFSSFSDLPNDPELTQSPTDCDQY